MACDGEAEGAAAGADKIELCADEPADAEEESSIAAAAVGRSPKAGGGDKLKRGATSGTFSETHIELIVRLAISDGCDRTLRLFELLLISLPVRAAADPSFSECGGRLQCANFFSTAKLF